MTRVLAIHLDKTLAIPADGDKLKTIVRHIEYKKGLDYYAIITKTLAQELRPVYSPVADMDVIGTNSKSRYAFLLDAYRIACKIIEQKKIDVITVQDQCWLGLLGLALKRKYKIPLNVQIHWEFINNPYFRKESLEYRLWDAAGRFVIPRADTFYVGTQREKNDLVKFGIEEQRIFHVPYTIITEAFEIGHPEKIRDNLQKRGFNNLLLWVGRMVKQKDLGTLIKAAARVIRAKPDTALILLGAGSEFHVVKTLAHKESISANLVLPGHVSQIECMNYYHAADIICMCSLYEGTCRVFLEAMAAAKPIVSTDVAGAFDAIKDGETGFIVKKQNALEFSTAILLLLNNKHLAYNMGLAGKKHLHASFTMDRHYEGFINMWNKTRAIGLKHWKFWN
jgi:glycosyltransferase involved in cell wall biosynthesis